MGHVDSAVMLHSRLKPGLRLLEILQLTRSLGERLDGADEAGVERWRWTDTGGERVDLQLRHGRLVQWQLARPEPAQGGEQPAA